MYVVINMGVISQLMGVKKTHNTIETAIWRSQATQQEEFCVLPVPVPMGKAPSFPAQRCEEVQLDVPNNGIFFSYIYPLVN